MTDTITSKQFKAINQLLARLIYAKDSSDGMRQAAKEARKDLHLLFGPDNTAGPAAENAGGTGT